MLSRRELLVGAAAIALPLRYVPKASVRLAVITDLHHGLAPDALSRLKAFAEAVRARRGLDAVLQMGDFCYSDAGAAECMDLWKTIPGDKMHVLGNHDMDKVDKDQAIAFFQMPARYGSRVMKGLRFIHLDLNHFKKDGKLFSYANGNYFTDGAACNWADPEQLDWLRNELKSSAEPVVILSHQPLGFAEPGQPLPPEQVEIMDILEHGKVTACLFGHLHVDRLEYCRGIPCLCVNSASYFWSSGMFAYSNPLFAFMEFGTDGFLRIEGARGAFVHQPPVASDNVIGRSASLSSRTFALRKAKGKGLSLPTPP